jgi:hypothetical protein
MNEIILIAKGVLHKKHEILSEKEEIKWAKQLGKKLAMDYIKEMCEATEEILKNG